MDQLFILYFDGCSKGNPGKAGSGSVLYENTKEIWCSSHFLGNTTNNVAEYYGLLYGLEEAKKRNIRNLLVRGDSQLVIYQMTGKYSVKATHLIDLYQKCKSLVSSFDSVVYEHVPRKDNGRADELSNLALYNNEK